MSPRIAVVAVVLLTSLACACSPKPHLTVTGAEAYPVGSPLVFGWDGIDSRMLMAYLVSDGPTGQVVDQSTYVFAGSSWTRASPAQSIPSLGGSRGLFVYDNELQRDLLVLAGPDDRKPPSPHRRVWEWDGSSWDPIDTVHALPWFSQNASIIYSPQLSAIVLVDWCSLGSRTWLFDGQDWRSLTTNHALDCFAHLDYDPGRHSVVALSMRTFQSWRFDGHDWLPIGAEASYGPSVVTGMGRQGPAVGFDQTHSQWVVFGGSDGGDTFGDTWTGDGVVWTKRAPAKSPPRRVGLSGLPFMGWDQSRHSLLLFGGANAIRGGIPAALDYADTWSWSGSNWLQVAGPLPPPASSARLTSPSSDAAQNSPMPVSAPADAGYKSFVSAKWRYSVQYPATWYEFPVYEGAGLNTMKAFSNENTESPEGMDSDGVFVTITVDPSPSRPCAEPAVAANDPRITSASISIDGEGTTQYLYLNGVGVSVSHNRWCYGFSVLTIDAKTRDKYKPEIAHLLSSFKFNR
ncbi:MAG TPA: hypothetical protein VG426_10075 [Candidatus Dormibacteraeota bacterium]|nr:hypothetical protein [Candidatus Dormibacteraeota bacterium]